MAPLQPHWQQPSHPAVQEVIINEAEFTSKSLSRVALPPFGLFAKMAFPPCTAADEPTYATVQMAKDRHLNLNSDLLYINHSCEPSLIFDTANLNVIAGPNGLKVGEELTFFYPSTEGHMAQPFDCLCGTATCRGRIAGAQDMKPEQLEGLWINGHIRELLEEQQQKKQTPVVVKNGNGNGSTQAKPSAAAAEDPTTRALQEALAHAEKVVESARAALGLYQQTTGHARRGPTSRELSGEMGGDTIMA
jgi:hypothetical protein